MTKMLDYKNGRGLSLSASRLRPFCSKKAYTIMEVMTVIAIVSVVSSIVLPGINSFFAGLRVQAEAEVFVQNIRFARHKALEEQALYRLIFDVSNPSITSPSAYRLQTNTCYDEGSAVTPNFADVSYTHEYDGLDWVSVIEDEEVMLDIELNTDLHEKALFFWPNGQIYTQADYAGPHSPIGEFFFDFKHGNAAIRVVLTPMGVFSSETFAADELSDLEENDVLW